MAPPTSVLSKTLQSITLTKIRELEKLRKSYENRKLSVLHDADKATDQHERIAKLLAGVEALHPESLYEPEISNIQQWLSQSRYDTSVSEKMLHSYEKTLRSKLEVQNRKMALASLYSQLLTEWMNPMPSDGPRSPDSDEDQSVVLETQRVRLQELCDKFESVVFEPYETDEDDIDSYLLAIFDRGEGTKDLEDIRTQLQFVSTQLMTATAPFSSETLEWCIKGLLAEDLLSDEKQSILQDFLQNDVVLGEIGDVLNMRWADINNWTWDADENGIPVMPRQGLNGKYRIWMDEGKNNTFAVFMSHY
jgi:hypothetical protein